MQKLANIKFFAKCIKFNKVGWKILAKLHAQSNFGFLEAFFLNFSLTLIKFAHLNHERRGDRRLISRFSLGYATSSYISLHNRDISYLYIPFPFIPFLYLFYKPLLVAGDTWSIDEVVQIECISSFRHSAFHHDVFCKIRSFSLVYTSGVHSFESSKTRNVGREECCKCDFRNFTLSMKQGWLFLDCAKFQRDVGSMELLYNVLVEACCIWSSSKGVFFPYHIIHIVNLSFFRRSEDIRGSNDSAFTNSSHLLAGVLLKVTFFFAAKATKFNKVGWKIFVK